MSGSYNKTINLALQGGGAHGAFAWGVLDQLLEDGRIGIDGICATSAGTMNACALAYGMEIGGADKAFWRGISEAGAALNPMAGMMGGVMGSMADSNPLSYFMMDSMTRMFSPSQLNPFGFNPLRDVLERVIDFDVLRACECVNLFISTTHVRSGKVKVFETPEISLDVAMGSACLPFLFEAVEMF